MREPAADAARDPGAPGRAAPPRPARFTRVARLAVDPLPDVLPEPRTTPFTFWYLVLLGLTTLVLRLVSPATMNHLLAWSSTDAVNLQHHALRVLLLSALWLPDAHWLPYAVIFTMVIAPLERRIGSRATVWVFASGHVLASLATEVPVLWAVHANLLPRIDAHLVDVGVSYGFFAAAGALLLMAPTPARWWLIGLLNVSILAIYLGTGPASVDSIVTAAGHLLSAYIGMLGWLPWLRRRQLIGSLRPPDWLARRRAVGGDTLMAVTRPGD